MCRNPVKGYILFEEYLLPHQPLNNMPHLKSHPLLLILDMQNGFCHPSGSFSAIGMPTTRQAAIIPSINHLRELCRTHHIPIFYTQTAFAADYSDAGIAEDELPGLKDAKGFIRGTWDAEIVEELKPLPEEVVVQKTRNNAFWRTGLEERLAERGVDQIIATGVATNVCVESTVREARSYGFHALTVSDGTATLSDQMQEASMVNLRFFGGTVTIRELEAELRERDQEGGRA